MNCPKCGTPLENTYRCPKCAYEEPIMKRIIQSSNYHYNIGSEQGQNTGFERCDRIASDEFEI